MDFRRLSRSMTQHIALRRRYAAEIEKIDNADLPASSPMYFCCRHCGIPTEVLPEDYVFPPMRECSQCQVKATTTRTGDSKW